MDTECNNNMEKLRQGAASLRSEQPGEGDKDVGSGTDAQPASKSSSKPRVRFSGAARRRHKRQLEKEKAVKALDSRAASVVSTEGAGNGAGPLGTQKRPRPDLSTPSPSERRQDKRPKVSDQVSFAQAAKIVKMAFILDGYPDKKLGSSEITIIKKQIRERILGLSTGTRAPLFTGVWERDGAIVCGCADEESAGWLKSLSSEVKVGDDFLRVLPLEELPKRHRVVVHVEEPDIDVKEAIVLIDKQNAGLAAGEWVVVRGSESRDAKSAHFAALVGDSALVALKNCGFKPFCGMGRATVRLTGKEHGKVAATASTKESV